MANELEPTLPLDEHKADDSEMLTQEWVVEGLVIATDKSRPQYIVTKVLAGHANVYPGEYQHHPLDSAHANYALSPEDFSQYSYRALVYDSDWYRATNDFYHDYLLATNLEVHVGDRIRVVRWSQEVPYEYDKFGGGKAVSTKIEYTENVTVLESEIDIEDEENRVIKQKRYVRKNFAGILRRLEQLQLQKRERLHTNIDTLINWEFDAKDGSTAARYVYGEGDIDDHFVNLAARPYTPAIDNPLPGNIRLTQTGRAFLQRNITAGGPSKELALIDEPLLELSASVWTETAYNPGVENIQVDFILDDVRYVGSIDVELSTRSFRNPGHHLVFTTFSDSAVAYDGVEINPDEASALFEYQNVIRELRFQASRAGIEAGAVQKELGETVSKDVEVTKSVLTELQIASQEAYSSIQPIVQQINDRESDANFGGARLLVPPE